MSDPNSTQTDSNDTSSGEGISFWKICLAVWNSLTPEEIQAWEDYAESLDENLSAFVAFFLVAGADKPTQPSRVPPSD